MRIGMSGRNLNRTELLRNLHHAFKSPLSSIFNLTDLILLGVEGEVSSEIRQDVVGIAEDAQRLNSAVTLVLEIFQFEGAELDWQDVDLVALLSNAANRLKETVQSAGHTLNLQVPSHVPTISADPAAIYQVIAKLTAHSVQFAQSAGLSIWVEVTPRYVIISVGEGREQPVVERDKMAELPGEQLKDTLSVTLLFCHRVIEAYGGELWASESSQHDLRINVSLPYSPEN